MTYPYQNFPYKKERELASFFKINRILQNMSLRSFAEVVGISASHLARIERGAEHISDALMEDLFIALDIPFDDKRFYENKNKFNEIYNDILYKRSISKIKSKIQKYNVLLSEKIYTQENIMINFVFSALYDRKNVKKYNDILIRIFDCLSDDMRMLYYQYTAYDYFCLGDIVKAKEYIDLTKRCAIANEHWRAMTKYIEGQINGKNGNYFVSHNLLVEAMKIFQSYNNYTRVIHCNASIGNIYLLTGNFEEAQMTFEELILISEDFNMDISDLRILYINLSLVSILKNDYEMFFKIFEKMPDNIKKLLSKDIKYICYRIKSYYKIGDYKQCLKFIDMYFTMNRSKEDDSFVLYHKLKIEGNDTQALKILSDYYDTLKKKENYNSILLISAMLKEEYKRVGDKDGLCNILEDIVEKFKKSKNR